jgi:uncharacterized SAM-dependent methyltransferase
MLDNANSSVVLYEGNGIDLYEAITRSKDYYLYNQELNLIKEFRDEIVSLPYADYSWYGSQEFWA